MADSREFPGIPEREFPVALVTAFLSTAVSRHSAVRCDRRVPLPTPRRVPTADYNVRAKVCGLRICTRYDRLSQQQLSFLPSIFTFLRFRDIAAFVLQHATFSHPTSIISPKFPHMFPWEYGRWMAFGLRRVKMLE